MNYISNTLLFSLIASFATARYTNRDQIKKTKTLFDVGCATQCKDHIGDPVDVSGVDFADLVSLYLDGNSTNTTDGNSTDFDNDAELIYGDIDCWDVSDVTDMSGAFAFQDEFNTDISCWNVASVTDMSEMFLEASTFSQNLNPWSTKVPRADVTTEDMLKGTACEVVDDPNPYGRPWCQFDRPLYSPQFNCFFFKRCDDVPSLFPGFGGRSRGKDLI